MQERIRYFKVKFCCCLCKPFLSFVLDYPSMQDRGIVKALDLFCTKNYRFCLLHSKNTLIEQT